MNFGFISLTILTNFYILYSCYHAANRMSLTTKTSIRIGYVILATAAFVQILLSLVGGLSFSDILYPIGISVYFFADKRCKLRRKQYELKPLIQNDNFVS